MCLLIYFKQFDPIHLIPLNFFGDIQDNNIVLNGAFSRWHIITLGNDSGMAAITSAKVVGTPYLETCFFLCSSLDHGSVC